VNNLSRTT